MTTSSCVVTGGARGIGRGIAERMVAQGYAVVVTDVDGPAAERTAGEIGAVAGLGLDVRDPGAHGRAAAEACRHGRLTTWFNNAGVGDDGRLAELDEETVRRLVEVNVLGTLWGMRAALAAFGPVGGDIVNTASLAGLGPVPGYAVYAATKAAIVSVSMSCDAETPRGVRVHALCPDGVRTAMLEQQTPAGWATCWSTPAAGSCRSTRWPTRRSGWSAVAGWCSRCRRGVARSCAPPRWRRRWRLGGWACSSRAGAGRCSGSPEATASPGGGYPQAVTGRFRSRWSFRSLLCGRLPGPVRSSPVRMAGRGPVAVSRGKEVFVKRTRSASVALGLLLVAGTGLGSSVLASCSGGDPKPKIAPSSPMSPSASDSPSPSQSLDQAFIAAFFQTIGQSTLSGDTSNFLAMTSPQCVNCRTLAGNIESAYEHGGHVEGGDWRVVEVERGGGGAPPDGEVWNVRVKTARERWFDGDGNLVKVVRPSVQKFGLLLSSGPDGALIRDLRLRS